MRSRVMHLVMSVCVYVYIYIYIHIHKRTQILTIYICMSTKNRLFSALLLENLLLSVICCLLFKIKCLQCGLLLRPVSCKDRAIHAFPNKMLSFPWPWNIFLCALTSHHTLWASCMQWDRQWYRLCAAISECFIDFHTSSVLFIHVCSKWNFRLSLCETTQAS